MDYMKETDEEEEIKNALSKEGYAFREAVREKLQNLGWHPSTEYPYSLDNYLKGRIPVLREPYAIDILGWKSVENTPNIGKKKMFLVIECKKGYQPMKKWVFLKTEKNRPCGFLCIENVGDMDNPTIIETTRKFNLKPEKADIVITNNGISFKKNKRELKSEGPDTGIYKASNQVVHALFGIKKEVKDEFETECIGSMITEVIFLPIVITNLPLHIADIQMKNTNDYTTLTDDTCKQSVAPWLIYNFPLPTYFHEYLTWYYDNYSQAYGQTFPFDKTVKKLPIVFLNLDHVENFLNKVFP